MTRELEIQFQEISIRTLLSEMDKIFHFLRTDSEDLTGNVDFDPKEILFEKRKEFQYLAERVYNLSIAYLELKNLPQYIKKFDEKILPFYKNKTKNYLSNASVSNIYEEEESALTKMYRQFLFSFRAFGGGDEKHLTGLDYLENILKSTNRILSAKPIKPSKESEVYNTVKVVLEATFPAKAQFPGGYNPFYKDAKCYKPDVLIPLLNCALEFKYAKTQKVLIKTIEEIHTDVHGYSDNPTYKFFYAIFYVKTGIITEQQFKGIWKNQKFPENWKEIFIEGEVKTSVAKRTKK